MDNVSELYHDGTSSEDSEPEFGNRSNNYSLNINSKLVNGRCFRCGRQGHFQNNCYAKTDIRGVPLRDDSDTSDIEDALTHTCCNRCGRTNHNASNCYASINIDGKRLRDKEDISSIPSPKSVKFLQISSSDREDTQNFDVNGEFSNESDRFSSDIDEFDTLSELFMTFIESLNNSFHFDDFESCCQRCGRNSHITKECYAQFDKNGSKIKGSSKTAREASELPKHVIDSNWIELNSENVSLLLNQSGIYEIAQKKGVKTIPVYVGMTGNLLMRLQTHLYKKIKIRNEIFESNIGEPMSIAKNRGFDIVFRTRITETREEAGSLESWLLSRYNYAWNILDNEKDEREHVD
jgi:hypothetical protein